MKAEAEGRQAAGHRGAGLYLALGVVAAALLVQSTLLSRLRFFGASPDLLLVVIVCWSVLRGVHEGMIWGFIAGLGADLIAGQPLGITSLGLMLPCLLASLGARRIFSVSLLLPVLLVALATPLHGWLVMLVKTAVGGPIQWWATTVRVVLPELGLNMLLTAMVYPLIRWVAGRLRGPGMGW